MKIHTNLTTYPTFNNPVITIGMFDGVHSGHQQILEQLVSTARNTNGESVLITFDSHPRMVLNQEAYKLKFINSYDEKIELIRNSGVNHLIILPFTKEFSKKSTTDFVSDFLVNTLHVKTLILGHNNHFGSRQNNDFNLLNDLSKEYNFGILKVDVKSIDDIEVSSTSIREALGNGDVKLANKMLGYKYCLTGKVIEGNRIGNEIGFPTANLDTENDFKLIPAMGVYAVEVEVEGKLHRGMLNIGIRPTLNINKLSIESHIFYFNKNIYGQYIKVYLVDRIRDEERFPSLALLIEQLKKDKATALDILNKGNEDDYL
ncbi:MAG: bifunctional riboflavin kinase/FAD synthetase [Bacteroidota bacterium]